jgi:hypothetical protein
MACSQVLNGIAAACETNVGGIREVYIANYDDVTEIEVDATTNMIDNITMAASAKFKKYFFKKNTSSLTSTLNVDATAGVNFVQSDLALVFAKQETVKRMEIAKLSLGELRVIVKDANGKYWFLGYEEFVSATAGTAETGVNRTDGNRYTITLTDYSSSYPYEVDPTIVDALVA